MYVGHSFFPISLYMNHKSIIIIINRLFMNYQIHINHLNSNRFKVFFLKDFCIDLSWQLETILSQVYRAQVGHEQKYLDSDTRLRRAWINFRTLWCAFPHKNKLFQKICILCAFLTSVKYASTKFSFPKEEIHILEVILITKDSRNGVII